MRADCVGLKHVPLEQRRLFSLGRANGLSPTLWSRADRVPDAAQPVYTRLLATETSVRQHLVLSSHLERHLAQRPSLHRIILGFFVSFCVLVSFK